MLVEIVGVCTLLTVEEGSTGSRVWFLDGAPIVLASVIVVLLLSATIKGSGALQNVGVNDGTCASSRLYGRARATQGKGRNGLRHLVFLESQIVESRPSPCLAPARNQPAGRMAERARQNSFNAGTGDCGIFVCPARTHAPTDVCHDTFSVNPR